MANNYNDFFNKHPNYSNGSMEYYEDTHDRVGGVYKPLPNGYRPPSAKPSKKGLGVPYFSNTAPTENYYIPTNAYMQYPHAMPIPSDKDKIAPLDYPQVLIYEPKTPEEIQSLIDFLKRKEPAIVDLSKVDCKVAQRMLDYLSGAIYALNGDVRRINPSVHIYFLSPEGVKVSVSKSIVEDN